MIRRTKHTQRAMFRPIWPMIAGRMPPLTLLERRRRQAARIALYGSLVLVGGAHRSRWSSSSTGRWRSAAAERWISATYASLPEVRLLQDYVQIDTSEATGDEVDGARFLAGEFAAAGIPSRIEMVAAAQANLYAWLDGRTPVRWCCTTTSTSRRPIRRSGSRRPSRRGSIAPWIYGRGVFDMKSVAIAQMLAMIDLKKSGKPLSARCSSSPPAARSTAAGWACAASCAQHPELVRSFWAVLTEGGVVEARSRDEIKYWGTEFAQKRYVDLLVCADDRERLDDLRRTCSSVGPTETDLRVTPEARKAFEVYGPTRDREDLRRSSLIPRRCMGDVAAFRKLPTMSARCSATRRCRSRSKQAPGRRLATADQAPPPARRPGWRTLCAKLLPRWLTFGLTGSSTSRRRARAAARRPPGVPGDPRRRSRRLPGRAGGPLVPPLDRDRLPLLPHGGHALLRLLPLPDHEHRHPPGRQGQRALRPARLRRGGGRLPRAGPPAAFSDNQWSARGANFCRGGSKHYLESIA